MSWRRCSASKSCCHALQTSRTALGTPLASGTCDASLALSDVLLKVLNKPIPIRIDGGLQVDKLVMPASVTIRCEQPLPVSGTVSVGTPVLITGPVRLGSIDRPVAINATVTASVQVEGAVTMKDTVTIGGTVDVEGKVGAEVKPRLLPYD